MGLLPSLKISFEKPSFGVSEEVKNLMKKPPKPKKDEQHRFWTLKERLIVGGILLITILGSLFFWYKGNGGKIEVNFPDFGDFGLTKTVVIEK